ncbi:TPM domain-containing protein [Rhodohalobacter halophilus]|uniref:TPM domain-containing protein n=1 Tax=Rhodohalobacter halophilus TaxID=1812810 RepID=UPI00083F6809|nr:TPM domain-containing protein [Rhodohalobacter halophilus]
MPAREFLSEEDEQKIVAAIEKAEKNTTGEIRVHLEFKCKGDPLERAKILFHELEMDQTEARNGVILYIASDDKKVAIYGDEGISSQVDDDFWQKEIDRLITAFKQEKFDEGIEIVVGDIGERLKSYFPGTKSNRDELDNEISFEDNRGKKNDE